MMISKAFVVVLIISWMSLSLTHANILNDVLENFPNPIKLLEKAHRYTKDGKLNLLDYFLLDVLPTLIGQSPSNENGTKEEFEEYLLADESNDEAWRLTIGQLIERSGYKYESYDAVAEDGYITTITRIINPLADKKLLLEPPILLEHGCIVDPTAYLVASSIQHHPEKWPQSGLDEPITSWNRSLAFVLANNGFDVWLGETRGSNESNRRRTISKVSEVTGYANVPTINATESNDYWSFSQDDIIAYELKSHIDVVLQNTGSTKINLATFSLSTLNSMSFFSIRPDYAEKVNGFVSIAPIVSGEGFNPFVKMILQNICPLLPEKVGTLVLTDMLLTENIRDALVFVAKAKPIRYSLIKAILTVIMGPSAKYQTLLDLNVMGHLLRQISLRQLRQLCQQTKSNKLQKFDYGPERNKILYNSVEPPIYDISDLKIKNWMLVSAANDALSTPSVINNFIKMVNPKPMAYVRAPGLNHLDLIAGFDNDVLVNLPILRYFQSLSWKPEPGPPSARGFDLMGFIPREWNPIKEFKVSRIYKNGTDHDDNVEAAILEAANIVDNIRKSISSAIEELKPFQLADQRQGPGKESGQRHKSRKMK